MVSETIKIAPISCRGRKILKFFPSPETMKLVCKGQIQAFNYLHNRQNVMEIHKIFCIEQDFSFRSILKTKSSRKKKLINFKTSSIKPLFWNYHLVFSNSNFLWSWSNFKFVVSIRASGCGHFLGLVLQQQQSEVPRK